ncbi:TonB-dependent receptor [Planctomycetota bacterium]|nr:TonB-dependent receptor [Planctomycetota bacterium]
MSFRNSLSILVPSLASLIGYSPALTAAEPATSAVVVTTDQPAKTTSTTESAKIALDGQAGGGSVIGQDEIRRGRTATLRDLLAGAPGVLVQPRFGSEESRLSIRGSGLQRTFHLRGLQLLHDGQPLNQADGGGDFQAFDPLLLDHAQVWRGANALERGAGTLGGAIDFVSPTGRTAPALRGRIEGGSFGYVKAAVTGAFAGETLDGWVGAVASHQDGFRVQSEQNNQRIHANVGLRLGDRAENRLFLGFSKSDSELPGSLTKADLKADPTRVNAGSRQRDTKRDYPLYRIADRVVVDLGGWQTEIGASYVRKELFHPLGFALIEQDSDDVAANLRLDNSADWFGQGNRVVAGVTALHGRTIALQYGYIGAFGHVRGAQQADAVQTASHLEGFAEWRHAWVGKLWSVLGVQAFTTRRDFEDRFLANGDQSASRNWREANPKIGLLWKAEDLQLFANAARSAEPPSFAEYVQRDPSGQTRPQGGLRDQTAWTVEAGSRGSLNDAVRWDVAGYWSWLRGEYLSFQTAPGLTQTINADRTIHAGLELGVAVTPFRSLAVQDDALTVDLTYTYGWFRFDGDAVYGDRQLPGLPAHHGRGEIRWESAGGWSVAPGLEWQSGWPVDYLHRQRADGVVLLNLRLGWKPAGGPQVFVEGRNLTDETYAATTGIANPLQPVETQALFNPGDGRSFSAGLEWSF